MTSTTTDTIRVAVFFILLAGGASAQDVKGIELCTHETRMDRRTGCLQSNIEYLQEQIAKTAADTQRKANAATAEIGALKAEIAALKGEVAAFRAALAAQQANIDKLQAGTSKRATDKPAPDKPAPDKPATK